MKSRNGVSLLVVLIFLCPRAWAGEAVTGSGSIQAGAMVKFLYGYIKRDDDTLVPGREEFNTSLVQVQLEGKLDERVSYRIELVSSFNTDTNTGGLNGPSGPGEIGSIGVREASISFHGLVPWMSCQVGTFMPPLTNYMPRALNDLDLISYPLLNNAVRMDTGMFGNRPAARDLSTWQQTGVNFTFQAPYSIEFDFGLFDGLMPAGLANAESNLAKATSMDLTFNPNQELSLSLALWNERFLMAYPGLAKGAQRNLSIWYIYGSYTTELIEFTADYGEGFIDRMQLDNAGDFKPLSWAAWQVTFGYWILPQLELLARHERIDPNSINNGKVPQSQYDESLWTTLGVNWRLVERAEVSVNYILKQELAWDVNDGKPGEDPNLPRYDPKYSAQRNDLILLQVQVWQ